MSDSAVTTTRRRPQLIQVGTAIAVRPDHFTLACAGYSGNGSLTCYALNVIDLSTGMRAGETVNAPCLVTALAYSSSSKYLVVGGHDTHHDVPVIQILDANTHSLNQMRRTSAPVSAIAIFKRSDDLDEVFVGLANGDVQLFTLTDHTFCFRADLTTASEIPIAAFAEHPEGSIVVIDSRSSLTRFDRYKGWEKRAIRVDESGCDPRRLLFVDSFLWVLFHDGLHMVDVDRMKLLEIVRIPDGDDMVDAVKIDAGRVAIVNSTGKMIIFNLRAVKCESVESFPLTSFVRIALAPDKTRVYATTMDGVIIEKLV